MCSVYTTLIHINWKPLEVLLLPRKVGLELLIPVGLRLSPNLRLGDSIKEGEVYEADGRK